MLRSFARAARAWGLTAVLVWGGFGVHDARANVWPPPKGAGLQDPTNWPNDPAYASAWNYWSWLPAQATGAPSFLSSDATLAASGMHIDTAWTYTIGRPDVRIAIADSGIEWDDPDLVNQVYLNPGELAGVHAPRDARGNSCGGTGALRGYDCDGDGVFSIADYREDPRLTTLVPNDPCFVNGDPTRPGTARMQGDVNHNCILDAGDLIELFSDGVDDDANGYTDDISGWDFFANDNDPYDDTRNGHGTRSAEESTAAANNAIGGAGVCPGCRFLMVRAGDSSTVEANDFAKAVVYATDNGASVLQAALVTVDQTAFSKAALDYAYAHGTVVVASVGEENSRHHDLPNVANHTLPVHAITLDGTVVSDGAGHSSTSASTFLAFNPCSNFGAQNMLSVSAQSCASEAAATAAGAAGLLFSEAIARGLRLSAEEAMQLLKMTADDIDVAESRSVDPAVSGLFYESKPGFDQRFGYGRPNLARAMASIDAGLLPPEVDIVSPDWFAVLYANRALVPIPVLGSVTAKRAASYDYRVEWGAGVEPDDAAFHPLVDWVRNVPGTTATGGAITPLALIAPGQIDTTHVPDPDSLQHENDRTITVRVVAIAHYPNGDVRGEARRAIAVVNARNQLDPDLLDGFPIAMGASIEASPKLADIDGDGLRDIVVGASDGSLHVYSLKTGKPVEIPGFPFHTAPIDGLDPHPSPTAFSVPSYLRAPAYVSGNSGGGIDPSIAREAIVATPAVGDVDSDGHPEIVVSTWPGTIYVVGSDGRLLAGWPKRLPLVPSCTLDPRLPGPAVCADPAHALARGAGASPVLNDFDGDGRLEIVQAAFDGNVYIWNAAGAALPGWPVLLHAAGAKTYGRILSTPALADFNADGVPDILSGSNERTGVGAVEGPAFLVDGRGTTTPAGSPYFANWPVEISSVPLMPLWAEGLGSAPAIASFSGTGDLAALLQGIGAPPKVFSSDPALGPQVHFDAPDMFGKGSRARADTMLPFFSEPAIGDLDQDGVPDVVMTGGSAGLVDQLSGQAPGPAVRHFQHLLAMWSGASGAMMYGAPVPLEDYTFRANDAVADITGDGYPEVLVGTGGYFLRAVDACGCEAPRWPKFTGGWPMATPAVGSLQSDGQLEVVAATREGNLFAWHTDGSASGVIQWASYHHDNANTGNYQRPLDQGVLEQAPRPIDCSSDCSGPSALPPPVVRGFEPGGGGCGVAGLAARSGAGRNAEGFSLVGVAFGIVVARTSARRRAQRGPKAEAALQRSRRRSYCAPLGAGVEGATLPE